jgi:hypothetical protein
MTIPAARLHTTPARPLRTLVYSCLGPTPAGITCPALCAAVEAGRQSRPSSTGAFRGAARLVFTHSAAGALRHPCARDWADGICPGATGRAT